MFLGITKGRPTRRRQIGAALAGTALVVALAACGGSANAGGNTTCGDFLAMDDNQRTEVIVQYFAEKGENDPAAGAVLLAVGSATLYCSTMGSASDPIKNIDG